MNARPYAPWAYNSVKTAFKLLVAELGGIDAAATCTRVERSQLSNYGTPNGDKFVPADVIMDLERVAGTPHITSALATAAGYVLVPVAVSHGTGNLAVHAAHIGQGVGELFATLSHALRQDKPEEKQRVDLLRQLSELSRTTAETISFLKQDV
jgi:hypothetical protein